MHDQSKVGSNLRAITACAIFVIFLTYRSFNSLFYLNWAFGIAGLSLTFAIVMVSGRVTSHLANTSVLTIGWLAIAVLLTPVATNVNNHLKILVISAFYIIASIGMVDILFRSKTNQSQLFEWLLYVWVLINGVLLLLFYIGLHDPRRGDFSGVFHDRNVFAITTVIVFTLSSGLSGFRFDRMNRPRLATLSFVLCSAMILTSKSMTGLLTLGVLLLYLIVFASQRVRWLLLFFVTVAVTAIWTTPNPIADRAARFILSATGHTEMLRISESAYIRPHLIREGIALFAERPFVGVGLDNARYHVFWPGRQSGSFLHNTYLDVATSIGAIGFVLYYFPIFWAWKRSWRLHKRIQKKDRSETTHALVTASALLSLKIVYDLTWTTYFEFGMIFSVVFAIYSVVAYKYAEWPGTHGRYHETSSMNYHVRREHLTAKTRATERNCK